MKKYHLYIIPIFLFLFNPLFAQNADKITWHSFEDAVTLNSQNHKKVFIDIYTDWCGWCKVLDKSTFPDTTIIRLMNKYFIAVKLNAERKDTVVFNGYSFVNPNPDGYRSPHQLASSLLKGRMMYPSMCFLDDSVRLITTVQSYLKPNELEPVLEYIGANKYLTMTYDSFKLSTKIIKSLMSNITQPNSSEKAIDYFMPKLDKMLELKLNGTSSSSMKQKIYFYKYTAPVNTYGLITEVYLDEKLGSNSIEHFTINDSVIYLTKSSGVDALHPDGITTIYNNMPIYFKLPRTGKKISWSYTKNTDSNAKNYEIYNCEAEYTTIKILNSDLNAIKLTQKIKIGNSTEDNYTINEELESGSKVFYYIKGIGLYQVVSQPDNVILWKLNDFNDKTETDYNLEETLKTK
jgi:thioredoxin-related protein